MKKPNKHLQTVYEDHSSKLRTTKIYQNIKENFYFSKGYPGGINWEYHPGKSNFAEERYFKISKRIYQELDQRLAVCKFLSGNEYTIADIATFPWIARHEWHDIGLKKFTNLKRWYEEISRREAVQKGFDLLNRGEIIPLV